MEYWSIEKTDIKPLAITPTLHYSNTPNSIEIQIFQQKDYLVLVYRTVYYWAGAMAWRSMILSRSGMPHLNGGRG